ncbi:cation efflux protein [Basidiobolus meristosporus CBS 931.73]|uniref:Cation efflux protein n=1 Tax=Basidiobolus meristosporus CBS 931.73 TaxID=1314790 RepID=A0A1Y1Y5T7_9FUNG|nr:cation efflux protein [Basidiobolus meristosporus CBS 931.73]|eukprot:ORX93363.1 cation efflux protein [Basidiobolus meristosporus CBS 931.73]
MLDYLSAPSDVISLAISLSAIYLAKKPPNKRFTYGFYRAEVLGVMASILVLWTLTIGLIYEASTRIKSPTKIEGKSMLLFGCLGLLLNIG